MSRDDLIEHINKQLRKPETPDGEPKESVVCQWCGNPIDENGQFVIHCVPEHGSDEQNYVFYCNRDCFNNHIDGITQGDF